MPQAIGIHVHRGIASYVIQDESVEIVRERLGVAVPDPNTADDDLSIWALNAEGDWERVSSFNFDQNAWA